MKYSLQQLSMWSRSPPVGGSFPPSWNWFHRWLVRLPLPAKMISKGKLCNLIYFINAWNWRFAILVIKWACTFFSIFPVSKSTFACFAYSVFLWMPTLFWLCLGCMFFQMDLFPTMIPSFYARIGGMFIAVGYFRLSWNLGVSHTFFFSFRCMGLSHTNTKFVCTDRFCRLLFFLNVQRCPWNRNSFFFTKHTMGCK